VDIGTLQAYAYFLLTVGMVVMLYWYIYYVHTGKKRGEDYERFSNLALNDGLDDEIVEEREEKEGMASSSGSEKKEK